jgi:hypothetical protein
MKDCPYRISTYSALYAAIFVAKHLESAIA